MEQNKKTKTNKRNKGSSTRETEIAERRGGVKAKFRSLPLPPPTIMTKDNETAAELLIVLSAKASQVIMLSNHIYYYNTTNYDYFI